MRSAPDALAPRPPAPTRGRATRRCAGIAATLCVAALIAGCGSSNGKSTSTTAASAATTSLVPPATTIGPQTFAAVRTAFAACMTRGHWHAVGNPAADAAARALAAQPGSQGLVVVADSRGDRAAVALFSTPAQAEHAQVMAGRAVGGKGHASAAPGSPLAWINYSGRRSADQTIATCAVAARRAS